jgi:hypothetical protein
MSRHSHFWRSGEGTQHEEQSGKVHAIRRELLLPENAATKNGDIP